jgi:hypothetical protein
MPHTFSQEPSPITLKHLVFLVLDDGSTENPQSFVLILVVLSLTSSDGVSSVIIQLAFNLQN